MQEWIKYTSWLSTVSKPQFDLLNAGASDEEIETLKKTFDFDLPHEVIELYKINNGQVDSPYQGPALISMTFLDIKSLFLNYNNWKSLYATELNVGETFGDYFNYEKEGGKSYPKKAIKIKYINLKWIPIFHDGGGNHIGIDLDPGENGTMGQVINFGRDQNEKFVMAKDLKTFFARINNLIENNKLQKIKASENGFGEEANFYLMSFDNPLATDLIGSLRKVINQNI
jgi:cell wall assembly regulator SMI1